MLWDDDLIGLLTNILWIETASDIKQLNYKKQFSSRLSRFAYWLVWMLFLDVAATNEVCDRHVWHYQS